MIEIDNFDARVKSTFDVKYAGDIITLYKLFDIPVTYIILYNYFRDIKDQTKFSIT